jgi:hypothetical protein
MFFRLRCAVAQCLSHVRAPFSIALMTVFGAVGTGIGLGHMLSQDGSDQAQKTAGSTTTVVLEDNNAWLSEESWRRRLKGRGSVWEASRSNLFDLSDQKPKSDERRSGGTYRTVCVRLCDGYYFPISFSTVKSQLAADENACQSRCAGDSRLFYYHTSEGSPETMVDRVGRSYADLKNAFLYRTKFEQSCQCRPAPWSKQAQQRHAMYRIKGWQKNATRLATILERQPKSKAGRGRYEQTFIAVNDRGQSTLPSTHTGTLGGVAGLSGRMSLGARSTRVVKKNRRQVVKRRKTSWKKNIFHSGSD